MAAGVPGETADLLEYLHGRLDVHFRQLHAARAQLQRSTPVFALEHGLDATNLDVLKAAVQAAVRQGFGVRLRRFWLPFVVYATEVGYDYEGDEYWPLFEAATPSWVTYGDRQLVKAFFLRFAEEYGGARPSGVWAKHFRIICWPITHAVLPTYLQRHLAQLLYEYRAGLTEAILSDPEALGERLASRSVNYTDRFRIFCQNTSLLGQVAAALMLSGDEEDEPSSYLLASTLHRILQGLSKQAQARAWLREAKQYARQIRSESQHSTGVSGAGRAIARPRISPHDPRLFLQRGPNGWAPMMALPNLSSLAPSLISGYDELRTRQATIAGVPERLVPGRLLYPGQEVTLRTWPPADQPVIQLIRGSTQVNELLASHCSLSPGPSWLFRIRPDGLAAHIKGSLVHPGARYCLVRRPEISSPDCPWITEVTLTATGADAYEVTVPSVVTEAEEATLNSLGLSIVTSVGVQPVGLVPAAWDGENAAEYLAGESATFAVRSDRTPERLVVIVDRSPTLLAWPSGAAQTFVSIENLEVGRHEVALVLQPPEDEAPSATVTLQITVRDPEVRPESATRGEGIRILASPAGPTLNELWDERATIRIDGPSDTRVNLSLTLRNLANGVLAKIDRSVLLPMTPDAWRAFARRELRSNDLTEHYDSADSCDLTVTRAGVGHASLHAERGYQPLRWVIGRRDRTPVAHLVDRSDGGETRSYFYSVESPTVANVRNVGDIIEIPPQGGLLSAVAGSSEAATVLPPDPNQLLVLGTVLPSIPAGERNAASIIRLIADHQRWLNADLPANPFARHQRDVVLRAITSELVSLASGSQRWSRLERALDHQNLLEHVDEMESHVGDSRPQRAAAQQIAQKLWNWAQNPEDRSQDFATAITDLAVAAGVADHLDLAMFLLSLTDSPGTLANWDPPDRVEMIETILRSPTLVRAARFAVLGTRALRVDDGRRQAAGGYQ
jgi:hypothetical protein